MAEQGRGWMDGREKQKKEKEGEISQTLMRRNTVECYCRFERKDGDVATG